MATDRFRTHLAGELGDAEIGTVVRIAGWIAFRRLHKRAAFLGVRDHSGTVQVVCAPEQAVDLTRESCVTVSGVVQSRLSPGRGSDGAAGLVEVAAARVEVLNPAAPLPFVIEGPDVDGEARMRWRYLDMRRRDLRRCLFLRAHLASALARSMEEQGFVELETPYLAHRSSGGAREFEVVSTGDPGRRYVLPQSSQVYRTMLMVGGVERYYQITRNFRDEWMRANRQFEFSVLDLEAAFVTRDDIMSWVEVAVTAACRQLVDHEVTLPFPRVPYAQQPTVAGNGRGSINFAWVVNPPLFVTHEGRLDTFHQPFDAPADGWADSLEDSPTDVPSTYFTLLAGGVEIGGGSSRIHQPGLLRRVLRLIGQENTNAAVIEALGYGAPPHAGFTLALDSLAALLLGEPSIRSVVPFPKSSAGRCAVFSPF